MTDNYLRKVSGYNKQRLLYMYSDCLRIMSCNAYRPHFCRSEAKAKVQNVWEIKSNMCLRVTWWVFLYP